MNAQLDYEIKQWQHEIKLASARSSVLQSSDFMQRNHYCDEGDFHSLNDVTTPEISQQQTPILNRIGKLIWE